MANSLKDINKNLDKLYMVLIMSSLCSYFDNACDQSLASDQIPSMDSLVTKLSVPTLLTNENLVEVI